VTGADAARWIARGRVAIGVALVAAPALAGRGWIGPDSERPGSQAILRAVGIRDLILGMLTLHVVDRPGVGYRTVATCAVADVVDLAAVLAARDGLPDSAVAGTAAVAGGAALVGAASAIALR
jgi:hypothetical protein